MDPRVRDDLLEIGRRLHARDLVGAAEGNLSVRLGPDRFLVTASGVSKGHLRAGDLVVVDGRGEVVAGAGGPRPSSGCTSPRTRPARTSRR